MQPMTKQTCGPIYALIIASLMVPAVALALMVDRALAAEPQMPESFQGPWCSNDNKPFLELDEPPSYRPLDQPPAYGVPPCDLSIQIEITATKVNIPTAPMSCVVRQVTKFDVCPWGMIFKNRKRAQALRSFQINPWSAGYHVILRCTSDPPPLKWSDLRYVFDIQEDCNGKEAIQA
jgi:hypothetical protein